MRTKNILSLLLAAMLALSFAACGGGKQNDATQTPTASPAAEPTEVPTQVPAETPTQAPAETPAKEATEVPTASVPKREYSYDGETRVFEDEFIRVTLPEGYSFAGDSTEFIQSTYPYELYLSFFADNSDEDFASNIMYMIYSVGGTEPDYSALTGEAVHKLMDQTYAMLNGTVSEFEFSSFAGDGYSGIRCEFKVVLMGIPCRQLLWSMTKDGTCAVLTYSYTDDDAAVCRASADGITVK